MPTRIDAKHLAGMDSIRRSDVIDLSEQTVIFIIDPGYGIQRFSCINAMHSTIIEIARATFYIVDGSSIAAGTGCGQHQQQHGHMPEVNHRPPLCL